MATIADNISQLKGQIASILKRLGKPADSVTLIGVTKFADISKIKEALSAGLADIGENKVQEGIKKFPELLKDFPAVQKHMIGHLQTNKVKQVLKLFDLIQSVDSLKLAEEIEKQARASGIVANILVQVNTAGEEQKFGIDPESALSLLEKLAQFKNVRVQGLMAIAPLTEDKEIVRACFRDLKKIYDLVAKNCNGQSNITMKYLSMGMSDDFVIALEEGSNMIRVGRAIFNE